MTITAKVEEGKIILPANVDWPSGTVVKVEKVEESESLADLLQPYIGIIDDLPADFAENHDRYIHGRNVE